MKKSFSSFCNLMGPSDNRHTVMSKNGGHMKEKLVLFAVAVFILALHVSVGAETPGRSTEELQILGQIGIQIAENTAALTGYTYQQRTAVKINGETKNVTLVQVAFGPDRKPLVTTLSSEPPETLSGGPVRRAIEEKKINEMKGMIQQVTQVANSYLILDQEKLGPVGRTAQVWVTPDGSTIRLVASNFQQPGDQITITCDGRAKRQVRTDVITTVFGGPMTVAAQYQQAPTGLNYNAQTQINVPEKALQETINTMNYVKQ